MTDSQKTTRLILRDDFAENFFSESRVSMKIDIAGATHVGKLRPTNEDQFAIVERRRTSRMLQTSLPDPQIANVDDFAYGIFVADGMGGFEFGEIASRLALETFLHASGLATSWIMHFKDMDSQQIKQRVAAYVERIQEAFDRSCLTQPELEMMGTTLTGTYIVPPHALVAHLGDSRIYISRNDDIVQVTRDQTLAQAMIDEGADESEVANLRHVLVNCLGGGKHAAEAEVLWFTLEDGDRLIICTDGLSDLVSSEEMLAGIADKPVQAGADRLIELALEAGGKDNITAVVCQVTETP